jgi:hypothetical protein
LTSTNITPDPPGAVTCAPLSPMPLVAVVPALAKVAAVPAAVVVVP